jgi:hypothetical protein
MGPQGISISHRGQHVLGRGFNALTRIVDDNDGRVSQQRVGV